MYIREAIIQDLKGLSGLRISFAQGQEAGLHVLLGDNGAGKTTLIRALALALVGPSEAMALREDWTRWVRAGADEATIKLKLLRDRQYDTVSGQGRTGPSDEVSAHLTIRTVPPEPNGPASTAPRRVELHGSPSSASRFAWGTGWGWFSSSFGPARRFTGGSSDYQRVFFSNPRVARHLSAFSEQVALSESLIWLVDKQRQGHADLVGRVSDFINSSNLLPHDVTLDGVDDQTVWFCDGNGVRINATELSDGYRSILSLALELLRQMELTYGINALFDDASATVKVPGVVLIDELDAHLHPSWQATVGEWFTSRFPKVQFIIATHSPFICRSIGKTGKVFRLRAPGHEGEPLEEIAGEERDKLWYGSLHRALESSGFGLAVGRSAYGRERVQELGALNRAARERDLTGEERLRRARLRAVLSDEEIPT